MWSLLEKITTQVKNYSSSLGQVWYMLVFGYRLVVITTLGGSVYGDEQGSFKCSTQQVGCENMCYNSFAKVSHLRFWAFQIIGVSTPTIFFHLYTLHVQGQIQKIKDAEKDLADVNSEDVMLGNVEYDPKMEKNVKNLERRRNQVGKYKMKDVYEGTEKKEVPRSPRIQAALILSLLIRLGVEVFFTYVGYSLFNIDNKGVNADASLSSFLWMRVPSMFICSFGDGDSELDKACGQHHGDTQYIGYVPCWVSRPYEKTVFLRYMNILSFVCMVITAVEILQFFVRQFSNKKANNKIAKNVQRHQNYHEHSLPYGKLTAANSVKRNGIYPDLGYVDEKKGQRGGLAKTKQPSYEMVSVYDSDMDSTHSSVRKSTRSVSEKRRESKN